MSSSLPAIIGITPFEHSDIGLALAVSRAGALGVVDLGHNEAIAQATLAHLAGRRGDVIGVRLAEYLELRGLSIPQNVEIVVAPLPVLLNALEHAPGLLRGRTVLVQVLNIEEAKQAAQLSVAGLIVKGHESSGRIGDETAFVLLQRVLTAVEIPVWVQGGIGLHTAAACIAAGARGVVVDSQLALLEDASTSPETRRALTAMDGSETVLANGYRLYSRLGSRAAQADFPPEMIAQELGATDPKHQLLTVGQDAGFAARIASRFGTSARFVSGLRRAMEGHLRQAQTLHPLAPNAPFAAAHGITYPIVQGPMTRVSDTAAFAESVANAGALPFLALALMQGEEAHNLLTETSRRLNGRPWGIGILGFVPAELREHQLELIRASKPSAVIIAGGRPSQARSLEDIGIATYLHVPSPGLLDAFLKDGARRFVFEGRECGGHVGPRTSFVLWEAAVERLLEVDELHDVSVVFAGGIHDARSASMVAALAAPLAARGCKVAVAMGTAYLFTQEAVDSGAIGQAFQEEAVRCEATALVETAPGHATRCAQSEFVDIFNRERARLEASGADAQTIWAELEQLNLGRLRIASKGLRREGDQIVQLDKPTQHNEGMFMIGQVAALRDRRCKVAELHRDVSVGSMEQLAKVSAPTVERIPEAVDIAIVGMACVFPDAPDVDAYWSNIVRGHNAVREVPKERWDPAHYYDPEGAGEKTPSKWGGFLKPVAFDPADYGIPPRSLAAIDPTQLLALHVARAALEDAKLLERGFDRERVGVVFGAEAGSDLATAYAFRGTYSQYIEGELPQELATSLPRLTEDSFAGVLANVISGRIANRLDLRGPNYTADAACASSLAALHSACKELATRSSDVMIAGGADLHNGIHDYLMFASVHALSPTGQCRTFDGKADGITLGEGVGAVVLKRLQDAERDGDHIYAVIKGIGASSDGKALGLTAPRKEGQVRAVERAYERAGVSPADVGLVEAHGTGTVVGDRTELAALTEMFMASGALPGSCTLGSVKSQIGHTKCAAGIAGLIKAALAVERGVLLPTNNVVAPNPGYHKSSPFVLRDKAAPWTAEKRYAGVSAFGFGGTNFHVVLASHESTELQPSAWAEWPAELFVLRAHDEAELLRAVSALEESAASEPQPKLCDLAKSAELFNAEAPIRCAIVARSIEELRDKLNAAKINQSKAGVYRAGPAAGPVAMLFPGQGSQSPGMLAELFVAFPSLRSPLAHGAQLLGRLFPGTAFTPEDRMQQQRAITDTRAAQPTLGMVELGMARLLRSVGVAPSMLGGHSYGELVALSVAGAFDEQTLLELSTARAACILEAAGDKPGTMAAVKAPVAELRAALPADLDVVIANHNAPDQAVIAGSDDAVAAAVEALTARGLKARSIPVACAFHSPIVSGASKTFGAVLAGADIGAPQLTVFANASGATYAASAQDVRAKLAEQVGASVRFVEEIEAMYAAGARVFVEAGPGGVLTDLVGRILKDKPHVAVACGANEKQALTSLLEALGRLIEAGVAVNPAPLFEGRGRQLELGSRRELPATAWLVDGLSARPVRGELPDFAMRPLEKRISLGSQRVVYGEDREGTVREFLRTSRDVIDAQRDVLLRFLGSEVPEPRARYREESYAASAVVAAPPAAALPAAAAPVEDPSAPKMTLLEVLVNSVADRTGYPTEMLDPDLDLEGDLGIDSIKRLEIVAALREKTGMAADSSNHDQATKDAMVERLAGAKTLRGIANLLESFSRGETGAEPSATKDAKDAPAPQAKPEQQPLAAVAANGHSVERYIVDIEPIEPATLESETVAGRTFVIAGGDPKVAQALSAQLLAHGAQVRMASADAELATTDGLIFLASESETPDLVQTLFKRIKEAVQANAQWIVAATWLGGRFGHHTHTRRLAPASAGVCGLIKSVARELPQSHVRVVDLAPDEAPEILADQLFMELVAGDRQLEVAYAEGVRSAPVVAKRASSIPPAPSKVMIDRTSVVLVTGGARGITGQIALEMARRFHCQLELVGRTKLSEDSEDAELQAALDANALRKVLISRMNGGGKTSPAAVEAQCRQILAEREVRATLKAIEDCGGRGAYHAVDVSDEKSFDALIVQLQKQHGRIDGVLHGAGRIEDKLLSDKTPESFSRVFATKVAGARVLMERLSGEAKFFVFFSSISSTFGNRGQTDYAAANDVLDKLAHWLHGSIDARVLSINWGPWRGIGMVRPELEREYEKRGIGLISPAEGIERFFAELLDGTDPQAILTAAGAAAFAEGLS